MNRRSFLGTLAAPLILPGTLTPPRNPARDPRPGDRFFRGDYYGRILAVTDIGVQFESVGCSGKSQTRPGCCDMRRIEECERERAMVEISDGDQAEKCADGWRWLQSLCNADTAWGNSITLQWLPLAMGRLAEPPKGKP